MKLACDARITQQHCRLSTAVVAACYRGELPIKPADVVQALAAPAAPEHGIGRANGISTPTKTACERDADQ